MFPGLFHFKEQCCCTELHSVQVLCGDGICGCKGAITSFKRPPSLGVFDECASIINFHLFFTYLFVDCLLFAG